MTPDTAFNKLVFLLCSERSGSNLITKIFNAHQNFCGPSPTHLFRTLYLNEEKYGDLSQDVNWQAMLTDVSDLLACSLADWETESPVGQLAQASGERSPRRILAELYAREAKHFGADSLFVKENQVYLFAEQLQRDYRNLGFLYLVRDPRDVALSYGLSPNHPGGFREGAEMWLRDQEQFLALRDHLGAEHVATIRYEDLIAAPEAVLTGACETLGISFDGAMLEFYRDPLTQKNAKRLENWANLGKPLLANNSNKFIGKLSQRQVDEIEAIVGSELMAEFGYLKCEHDLSNPELQPVNQQAMSDFENELRTRRRQVIDRIIKRTPHV